MVTPKVEREAPLRLFENYTASIQKLTTGQPDSVPDTAFQNYLIDLNTLTPPASSYNKTERRDVPIGFDFIVNGMSFDKFCITSHGWILLLPKSDFFGGGVPNWWNAYTAFLNPGQDPWEADQIKPQSWRRNGIILAPFMRYHTPIPRNLEILQTLPEWPATLTTTELENFNQGKSNLIWPVDAFDYGVRYCNFYDKNYGRCCIVRWSTFVITDITSTSVSKKYKFEISIFENGRIEFRYWPSSEFQKADPPYLTSLGFPTTVGVFWNMSISMGAEKPSFGFRDFTPLFDYQRNERKLSELGGYNIYESSPSWLDPSTSTYHGSGPSVVNKIENTIKNGAVIVFSPPVNTGKFIKKSVQTIKGNKNIVRDPGLFDDRRTVAFETSPHSGILHMPSTLPTRLVGDTGAVDVSHRQHLYLKRDDILYGTGPGNNYRYTQENILEVTGSTRKAAVDTLLDQIDSEIVARSHTDSSFNESSHLYEVTAPSNEFYASGSSFEQFGDGFTTPLKSKTKFHFSLPITKQTTMPALQSSIYYYDGGEQAWRMVDPAGNRDIFPIRIGQKVFGPPGYGEETDEEYYYKVTETNRGFDAVGRKCSLSSEFEPTISDLTFQTGPYIGAIANVNNELNKNEPFPLSGSNTTNNDLLAVKYPSSLWENEKTFPKKDQQISLPIEYPFLIEKLVIEFPFYAEDEWFDDKTTITRGFGIGESSSTPQKAKYFFHTPCGPIDFGGPGLTFSLLCPRRNGGLVRMDLIASGTITHNNDVQKIEMVALEQNGETNGTWTIRQTGFESFSNPTVVVQETVDPLSGKRFFNGKIKMEIFPCVSAGVTYAFNHRAYACDGVDSNLGQTFSTEWEDVNKYKAEMLLTNDYNFGLHAENFWQFDTGELFGLGVGYFKFVAAAKNANFYNNWLDQKNGNDYTTIPGPKIYEQSFGSPRVHVMNVSALPRGSTGIDFNGNSILGGNIARIEEKQIKNPFFVSDNLPTEYSDKFAIMIARYFQFDAVASWSTFTSKVSPYLMLPGDKLTLAISKTRPVVNAFERTPAAITAEVYGYGGVSGDIYLAGSHNTVILNTGSIEMTVYGSYVKEGMEYNP
jgi:hypothetical protein